MQLLQLKKFALSRRRFVLIAVCGGLLSVTNTSCKKNSPVSRVKIDSGELITSESANQVEGVFQSITNEDGICTGTAVSTSTALTAAHCLEATEDLVDKETGKVSGREYCIVDPSYKKICSKEIFMDYQYMVNLKSALVNPEGAKLWKERGADIAWVVFPKGTFKFIFLVQDRNSLRVDDAVVMVGYSPDNLPDDSEGT